MVQATFEAWSLLTKNNFTDEPSHSLDVPLTTYAYFIQNFLTHHWKQKGIHYNTADLVNPTAVDTFMIQQIKQYNKKTQPLPRKFH